MLVAISGGSGFIGRHLAQLHIARGDRVRVLVRANSIPPGESGIEFVQGDITVADHRLRNFTANADVLYHCAAELANPARMQAVNIDGTRNLVAAATGTIGRWVQLSSVAVYGRPAITPITETTATVPTTQYGETKLATEHIVHTAAAAGAFSCCTVRPSIVFGEDMPGRALFQLLTMIEKRLFFFIGKPGATMNYIHVDNVVTALALCATHAAAAGGIFNLSATLTLERFVEIAAAELNVKPPSLRLPEPLLRCFATMARPLPRFPLTSERIDALTGRSVYSAERIRETLAYNPASSLESGLRTFVRHWKSHRAHATKQ